MHPKHAQVDALDAKLVSEGRPGLQAMCPEDLVHVSFCVQLS